MRQIWCRYHTILSEVLGAEQTISPASVRNFGADLLSRLSRHLLKSRLLGGLKMFFCAISGEVPSEPVIAAPSGHVYEKRLIEKYIAENGTDPVTGNKLETSDLIAVKASEY